MSVIGKKAEKGLEGWTSVIVDGKHLASKDGVLQTVADIP